MATKTQEGAEAGTEAQGDETVVDATTEREAARADAVEEETRAERESAAEEEQEPAAGAGQPEPGKEKTPSGVGQGAGAVVSAALGFVSLSGGWIGTVAGAREQLVGQLRTSSTAGVATQIKAVYGNAWHTTALWAGLFALAALLTGVVVLARPAFGTPGRPQAPWIKSVAWAGVVLGVVGLLLAVLKYSDALLALPSAS
ncbi:hypothetical protein AB0N17_18725 [Streptomyces sp. NPDC051133]|uniref:hypothetical protein n=1 Tax=Streptomyces sp. NPDC051133 TaxID=3155521 RepID=UPI003427460E